MEGRKESMKKIIHVGIFILGLYATFFMPKAEGVKYGFLSLAIPAIAALAGGLSNKGSKTSQNTITSTTPNLSSSGMDLRDQIIQQYLSQLGGTDLSGYTSSGISNINKNAEAAKKRTTENLSARGISGPALDFALTNVDNQRFGDVTSFQNSIPLLQQQLQSQILSNAGNYLGSNPFGTTQKGTGTSTQPGNFVGGALGNLGSTLAYMYGQGAFKPKVNTVDNINV